MATRVYVVMGIVCKDGGTLKTAVGVIAEERKANTRERAECIVLGRVMGLCESDPSGSQKDYPPPAPPSSPPSPRSCPYGFALGMKKVLMGRFI